MKLKLIVIISLILFSCNEEQNPRQMKGKTQWETRDSIYYITFKIDSVIAQETEPPISRNDR